jgi:hypothetical protein
LCGRRLLFAIAKRSIRADRRGQRACGQREKRSKMRVRAINGRQAGSSAGSKRSLRRQARAARAAAVTAEWRSLHPRERPGRVPPGEAARVAVAPRVLRAAAACDPTRAVTPTVGIGHEAHRLVVAFLGRHHVVPNEQRRSAPSRRLSFGVGFGFGFGLGLGLGRGLGLGPGRGLGLGLGLGNGLGYGLGRQLNRGSAVDRSLRLVWFRCSRP